MSSIRTDMADEIRENLGSEPQGVEMEEKISPAGMKLVSVHIRTAAGEKAMGRPRGSYITMETESELTLEPKRRLLLFARDVGRQMRRLARGALDGTILIIGLGNRSVTPDALGPKVCEKVFVSRHIKASLPELLDGRAGDVCALAPGVLGVTGIETEETVRGVAKQLAPELIVIVDALATGKLARIGNSIQLSNTGISPGSGIGNIRKALSEKTLGARVIVIGVPTVTYASSIAADLIEGAAGKGIGGREAERVMRAVSSQGENELIVTPKNVDMMIEKTAYVIAEALNYALHPHLGHRDIEELME